ncbi:MAG: ABC transporter ATP-binding protein [Bacteroidales bacterium]
MSETVIKVENLSKLYRLGEISTGTLRSDIQRWWAQMRGKEDPLAKIGHENDRSRKAEKDEVVWALKDINFEVKQGEVLGIIGKNGAGKSTLLKILSQVTTPTTGNIKVRGRIASLLEVGTGFHPELTGRENIFLNGAILGMTKAEIRGKFDEIVDFAGIAKYIDTPVKRYSSGMYVRLAFAVAAHLDPEILIVDEVLAVGDAEFQKKALGKMQQISHGQGRTVLFVSHNMSTIRNLCQQAMLLTNGKVKYSGPSNEVVNLYEENFLNRTEAFWINNEKNKYPSRLERIEIRNKTGDVINEFFTSDEIYVHIFIKNYEALKNAKIGFDLLHDGAVVFRTQQVDSLNSAELTPNTEYEFICKIPSWLLNHGEYQIRPLFSIHCAESLTTIFDNIISLNVKINPERSVFHQLLNTQNHPGSVFPILKWEVNVS